MQYRRPPPPTGRWPPSPETQILLAIVPEQVAREFRLCGSGHRYRTTHAHASVTARRNGGHSYKSVKTILSAGLDQADPAEQRSLSLPADHAHVRGPDYYANSHNGKET